MLPALYLVTFGRDDGRGGARFLQCRLRFGQLHLFKTIRYQDGDSPAIQICPHNDLLDDYCLPLSYWLLVTTYWLPLTAHDLCTYSSQILRYHVSRRSCPQITQITQTKRKRSPHSSP